jgi:pyruvate/2-oxoglutarate dehydrogenase complex dihydrolipoamide dehydrogenase (E3) component
MPDSEHYELLVLGSGEGGKYLAWHMAQSGHRSAVIERKLIGGSCPNTNCLPSKNEIWSAEVAHLVFRGAEFGTSVSSARVDMAKVRARKREMVDGLIAMHLGKFRQSGAELIMGTGRFVAPKTIEVKLNNGGTRVLTGDRVVINIGTHATVPDVPGLAASAPLTNVEALELDRIPRHLIVIGGGYVGLELAQAYRRFGSLVTIIEHGPQLIAREDPEVAEFVRQILTSEGIVVLLSAEVLRVEGRCGEAVSLAVRTQEGEQTIEGSDILVAAGRTPSTAEVGLDRTGVELDERGYVKVNDRLETSAADTWAIGECAGSEQFTHVSFDDFRIVRDNFAGTARSKRGRLVPFCVFLDPPLARVGLNEVEARRKGVAVRVVKLPMAAVLRTRTIGETRGYMKALVDAHSDRIVGFSMIGLDAGEVMAAVQVAMLAGMPYTGLRDAIMTHPTMAEGLVGLFSAVPAMAN